MPTRTWRGNTYRFTVTSATAAAGDTYTNNGQTFTVTDSITAGTVLYCTGTGAPSAAPGNLVRVTGAGTNPIAYSAFTSPNTNWGTTTNWLENAIPTTADDVIFDANSGNCNLNVNGVCRSFDANTYGAKTWSLNSNSINVGTGIFRLGTGMIVTGNGTFIRNTNVAGTMTMTSNGVVWPGNVTFAINATGMSWADNWTILGNFLFGGFASVTGTATITIGGSLTNAGGVSASPNSTATYVLNGTGTLDGNFTMLIVINTSGIITLPTSLRPGTLNYITAGNVIVNPGHTYIMRDGSSHLTDRTSTGGSKINFFNLTGFQSGTVTLLSNLTVTNNYTNNVNVAFAGGFTIFIAGNLLSNGFILNPSLTKTTLELNGPTSSTVQSTAVPAAIYTNLIINKSAGATVTFLSNILFGDATFPNSILQLTAGFVNPGSFTITTNASCVINNMTLNNLTVGATVTQNTANTINGTLLVNISTTFAGTAGWTCGTLICTTTTASRTITLQNSVTYRTTTGVQLVGTTANTITMISNNASIRAIWTLDYGATQNIIYVNGTRIDSSLGQTIWTFGGLISTTPLGAETLNWRTGTRPGTIAYVFLN